MRAPVRSLQVASATGVEILTEALRVYVCAQAVLPLCPSRASMSRSQRGGRGDGTCEATSPSSS
jgi:hypothetical protein